MSQAPQPPIVIRSNMVKLQEATPAKCQSNWGNMGAHFRWDGHCTFFGPSSLKISVNNLGTRQELLAGQIWGSLTLFSLCSELVGRVRIIQVTMLISERNKTLYGGEKVANRQTGLISVQSLVLIREERCRSVGYLELNFLHRQGEGSIHKI